MKNSMTDLVKAEAEARNRRRWLIGTVATMATLGGFGLAWHTFQSTDGVDGTGSGFWRLEFVTPEGQMLRTYSLRNRNLLLNFWASWCPPCVDELPLLSRFYSENLANGWQVLGLAIDEPDPVKRFLAHAPVSFPVAMGGASGLELSRALGNQIGGLPFTVVLDSEGFVVHRKMGPISADDLRTWTAAKQP